MPNRRLSIAAALAVPLLLAACEEEAEQEARVGQAEEPAVIEAEPAPAAEPDIAPPEAEPAPPQAETAPPAEPLPLATEDLRQDGESVVVPPAGEATEGNERDETRAPGEQSPQAAGVASVAAYVGRWAAEPRMCERAFWTFTNLRLQSPDDLAPEILDCDIEGTEQRADGVALSVACADPDQPLAEPDTQQIVLTFPNLPQTDTMVVSGGPLPGEITLTRCRLGEDPAAAGIPEPQNP